MSIIDITRLFEKKIQEVESRLVVSMNNSHNMSNSHNNITINAITNINVEYLTIDHTKELLQNIAKNSKSYETLCVDYLHKVFNNTDHPENHCITVINKVLNG